MKNFLYVLAILSFSLPLFSNTCLNFDGIDDYIQVNEAVIPSTGDFTVSVWANAVTSISGYKEILSQNAGTGGEDFYIGHATNGNVRAGDNWDASENATSYRVFSSDDPNGVFEEASGTFNGLSWSASLSEMKKFYYLLSVN